ncbi:HNH endonuclease family protein [Streptomyces sp. XD-27]|uniref:HNH endonuclease family protein n=1 Tax=Streptomyces sp. XD-27 TaxID=3062779 RepID=UPI0026F471C4|nr:HNH endonuclease family protein [Streptomyces sp. XD-27]WKX73045.1 HNH endonuclease family protein [Streptomyces sp. XD-27]
MINQPRSRRALAFAAALGTALALVPASVSSAEPAASAARGAAAYVPVGPAEMPEPPEVAEIRAELEQLAVAEPHDMEGYSRARFPHWVDQGERCDTREVVLQRDGENVVQDDMCRATSGSWVSRYDGRTLNAASQVDIDHMVPLANAWRSGADEWTTAQRRRFANDLTNSQLIAVSAASNRSKADKGPDAWKPPSVDYWCTYSRAWVSVKYLYKLNITAREGRELNRMLNTCD